jgi:spectinomycin phosphotransferase
MLRKPDINDQEILKCVQEAYGLKASNICFLPLGADFNTAVYRITSTDKKDYFLKLRCGVFFEASVMVPKYLRECGLKQVISPLATKSGQLWTNLSYFKAILYPYIDGCNAIEAKLSDQQWIQLGAIIKKIHSNDIPKALRTNAVQETFSSAWCEKVAAFLERIENEVFEETVAEKMALFLKSKSEQIFSLIKRTEELRCTLQKQPLACVLCHADIHGWNLLIDKNDDLYLLDWDTLILAPKERDLMFIGAGIWDSGCTATEEGSLFYKGYGQADINQKAIAYYRFERIIQDIGEYCEQIFLSGEGGEDRAQSFEYLQANFLPNGTIEKACQSQSNI